MGQDRGVRFKRRKTNVAKVDYNNPNPIWNETVNVTESEGLEWATYIRIEVFDLNKPKEEGGRLGAAFIPIDTIPTEAANVKDYPLTPHRSPESYVRWHRMAGTEYGMGSVTVRCQRKLYRTAESNGSVIIRSQLREVGTLDTFWRAKSVLSGSLFIVDSVKITEECNVFASLDGLYVDVVTKNYKDIISNPLKYFTVDASTMLVARNEDEKHEEHSHGILNIFHSSASSSRRRKSSSAEAVPSTGGNNIFAVGRSAFNRTAAEAQFHKDQENFGFLIEVFCFENQRKGFSNKEFSASNLLVTERPWLSDETGMIPFPFESLEACNPPDGYEWLEDKWGRDFEYTACDDEGWSYSADFINIMANLKKNDSNKEDKNFFVRRRKWGRFARRLFYPRSGMTLCEMRSALAGSTTLNSQLEPIPFPSNSLNRQQVFEREGDGSVLALCLERGSSDENGNCSGPVIIPWNQVMSIHVITPTVLSLVVEIRRYLGSAASLSNDQSKTENFVNAQCELFLYNCPADDLSLMLNERMSVSEAREELHSLLVSKHINGSEGVERDAAEVQNGNHGDAAGWVEGEATGNLEDDLDDITASIALSKASVLMSKLDEAVMLMETKMSKLEKKHGSSVSLIEEYDLLTLRISRLMLYLAALLGAGLQGGEASLETYEKDRSVAESLHTSALQRGADPVSASIDQVNFLLDAMEGRVRNLSLTGFKMKNDELDRLLSELMNAYYVEIIRVLAVFFDSLKKMEAINVSYCCQQRLFQINFSFT